MRKSIMAGLVAAAVLGGSAAAYPPMPVFNGTFVGVEVPMPPSAGGGGSFYGSGSAGATAVTVYYSPSMVANYNWRLVAMPDSYSGDATESGQLTYAPSASSLMLQAPF